MFPPQSLNCSIASFSLYNLLHDSIDARTGCVYWSYQAAGAVRSAVSIGPANGRYLAYFGDLKGNVYAVDAATGAQVWKTSADSHPLARVTGAPQLYQDRLYVPVS